MMTAETSDPRRARGGSGDPTETPQGIELLDDLLKELDDGPPPEGPAAGAPSPASVAPGSIEGATDHASNALPRNEDAVEDAHHLDDARRSAELARAEANSLKGALDRQQGVEVELRREMGDLRGQISRLKLQLDEANARFLPAAPVAFLDAEGKAVARKAFYALGKGEALDAYLSDLLLAWKSAGGKLVASWDGDGFSLTLEGDPDRRGIRILSSGVYLVQLSEQERSALGNLPTLVRKRREPSSPSDPE
jgi:hypothetical protein